jgi:hypothetical protein
MRAGTAQPQAGDMVEIECPWCEATLMVDLSDEAAEQSCPECLTSWSFAEAPAQAALPLAAWRSMVASSAPS